MRKYRYYSKLYKGSYGGLFASFAASIGQSIILLAIPFLVRYAFDDVITSGESDLLILVGLALLALYLANGGISLWAQYVTIGLTKRAIQRFRDEILQQFYRFSRTYYNKADLSMLHTSIVHDTERVDDMGTALVTRLLPALVVSIALCAVLIFLDWFLFLLMCSIFPILFLLSKSLGNMLKRRVRDYRRSFGLFSRGMLFVLQMMDLTRIQSAEQYEFQRQRSELEKLRITSGSMDMLKTAYSLAQDMVLASVLVIILVAGGRAIGAGTMSLGDLLSFYAAVVLLKSHLRIISFALPHVIQGQESLAALFNLLQIDDSGPYHGTKQIAFEGKIVLDSVSFQYDDSPVLRDIDVTIDRNATVALVGPNGAGKTTIVNLILGFYRPQKGRICADGHPLDELDLVHLRRQIGVVSQNPTFFPGTVSENLSYGCPDATTEQIVQAARIAAAHEFIVGLPQGYDTLVGQGELLLSGGQSQRIALARSLLRRPRLLILDEPTNRLDDEGVRQFMSNLNQLKEAPAIFIITHNRDIVRETDEVYVLKEGRVVAAGRGETLDDKDSQPRAVSSNQGARE